MSCVLCIDHIQSCIMWKTIVRMYRHINIDYHGNRDASCCAKAGYSASDMVQN